MPTPLFRIVALVSLAMVAQSAAATATYGTGASSTFFFGGGGIIVEVGSDVGSKFEVGTGSAGYIADVSADGVRPATISEGVAGSASSPPTSFATSTYMAGHVFRIDNSLGLTAITIPFEFSYSWITEISADDPSREFASSGAFFGISGFEGGIDAIDIDGDGFGFLTDVPGTSAYLFNPTYATSLGETGSGGILTSGVTGVIKVEAGEIGAFSVITDSTGRAFSIPEPRSAVLVAIALCLLVMARRGASARLARVHSRQVRQRGPAGSDFLVHQRRGLVMRPAFTATDAGPGWRTSL